MKVLQYFISKNILINIKYYHCNLLLFINITIVILPKNTYYALDNIKKKVLIIVNVVITYS